MKWTSASHHELAKHLDFHSTVWLNRCSFFEIIPRKKMVLPKLNRCCFCVPLEVGGFTVVLISLMACIGALAFCSVILPHSASLQNEDNIVLLSMTMFSTLSAISNGVCLTGIAIRRLSFLQMSLLTNAVFMLCIMLICAVTLLFSPWLQQHWLYVDGSLSAVNVVLAILLLLAAGVYALYHLTIVNSLYTKMKMTYGDSIIPYHV